MATYQYYAYAAKALVYNSSTGAFELSPDYDHTQHRILVTITDDDRYFDGDQKLNESGDDSNQTAVVTTPDGRVIASGKVYDEAFAILSDDSTKSAVYLERIEIGGVHLGYFSSETLVPGKSYPVVSSNEVTSDPDNRLTYDQINSVPCFGPGMHLDTDKGPVPVDWLAKGDRVLTLDHGYQPVLWVGRSKVSARDMAANPALRPVIIPAGRFGGDGPARDLILSPEHRVLVASAAIECHFGAHQALAACKFLCNGAADMPCAGGDGFSYYHVLFARHEIVRAEGLWVESFFTGDMGLRALGPAERRGVADALRDFGGVGAMQSARYILHRWEAEMLGLSLWRPERVTEGARYGSKIA